MESSQFKTKKIDVGQKCQSENDGCINLGRAERELVDLGRPVRCGRGRPKELWDKMFKSG